MAPQISKFLKHELTKKSVKILSEGAYPKVQNGIWVITIAIFTLEVIER